MVPNRIKKNPVKVLTIPVDFRDSKGRFSTISRASYFIVKISGLRLDFNFPKKEGRKLNKKERDIFVVEIVDELKRQLIESEVAGIEARREKVVKKRAKKPTDKVKWESQETEHEYFSRLDKKKLRMQGYYYWFKPPYEITDKTSPRIMQTVYSFAYERMVEVVNKNRLKGWRYQIKILGGGEYLRQNNKGKWVEDIFGFSNVRVSVPKNRNILKKDIKLNYDRFLEKVTKESSKFGSYFARLTSKHLDEYDRDRILFIHGVKLSFTKEI